MGSTPRSRFWKVAGTVAGLAATAVLSAAVLLHFHDHFWLPRDSGYYAHIGERVLEGEVLHREVQAFHSGYVYFAHAGALAMFGRDLVSLRYPLVALGILQALLVFALLRQHGAALAVATGLAVTSASFVQFLDPTAHWYCLFFFFVLVAASARSWPNERRRDMTLGALLGLILLLRQPTGIFLTMGVLAWLLGGAESRQTVPRPRLARAVLLMAVAGLVFYAASKPEPLALLLFGLPPAIILVSAAITTGSDDRRTASILIGLSLGGAVAAGPLIIYHLLHGSVMAWLDDTVVASWALSQLAYQQTARYGALISDAAFQLLSPDSVSAAVNQIFLIALVVLPGLLGATVARRIASSSSAARRMHPLPFLAVFYSLVAVHYQDKTYLFFIAGPAVAGLTFLVVRQWARAVATVAALAFSSWALYFHAGQPYSRGWDGLLAGTRVPFVPSDGIDRSSLWIEADDLAQYRELLGRIERDSGPEEAILALPANADLYFLSRRRNPLPYSFVSFGIRDRESLEAALATLAADPPVLIFYVPSLPYNTVWTEQLMDGYRATYERLDDIGRFEIYRRPRRAPSWFRDSLGRAAPRARDLTPTRQETDS